MKAAHYPVGRHPDVIDDTSIASQWPKRLIRFIFKICCAIRDRHEKFIYRTILAVIAASPGTAVAQSADQLRPIQNIFEPLSKPAELLNDTARLVLLICLIIFLVVGGLLLYSVWRYRRKAGDDDTEEPSQVYGSNAIELAWTIPPILIVIVLILITARTVGEVNAIHSTKDTIQLRVVGHRFWWELQYPAYGV